MTLSKALRDEARRKLGGITTQALNSRVRTKCRKEKIADLDIGLLLVAFEDAGIIVSKPQYRVPSEKLKVFQDHLDSKKNTTVPTEVVRAFKKIEKAKPPKGPNLLSFKGKTPSYPYHVFYSKLEDEINTAYRDVRLPNAALVLSRKLVENLLFNLFQYKFTPKRLELYFDKGRGRAEDFSVLIDNLKSNTSDFPEDQQLSVEKFLKLADPFRTDANKKIHQVMEYLDSIAQIKKYKIPEMVEILIELISQVRSESSEKNG
jgi:hypothetical protein